MMRLAVTPSTDATIALGLYCKASFRSRKAAMIRFLIAILPTSFYFLWLL